MNTSHIRRAILFFFLILTAAALTSSPFACRRAGADEPAKPAAPSPELAGVWQGSLSVMGVELRLIVHVVKQDDGSLKGTLDSPDQGAKRLPLDEVKLEEGAVRLALKAAAASFEGKLSEDGQQIEGQWKQGGGELALVLKRLEKEPDLSRPQEPKKPYPYGEEEVSYENQEAGIKLAGTLTLPEVQGRAPAVLLISGSGAQDRDEALLGHRPFLVLADYLTRRGIAVLRVDDRGVGGSTGDVGTSTTKDFAGDALAGVRYLRTRKEIDPRKIGLVGHSEGGLIAPLAASTSEQVAFIVMMAGTGVTGEEILYRQGELIARAAGAPDDTIAETRKTQEQTFAIVKEEADDAKAESRLRELFAEALAKNPPAAAASQEAIQAQVDAQLKAVISPWFRAFLTYDPRPALTKVKCPVLAINGEKDVQVDPKQNLPEIEKALVSGGHKDHTLTELPGLNHLFQTSETGSVTEYGKIEETFSPAALEVIGDWIAEHTR